MGINDDTLLESNGQRLPLSAFAQLNAAATGTSYESARAGILIALEAAQGSGARERGTAIYRVLQ